MVKIEIDVDQVITSAVALEIEPGDRLLVMNGVVIGLAEGRLPRARLASPVINAEPTPPAPQTPTGRPAQHGRVISAHDREVERKIVEQLRIKPLTANELSTRLSRNNGGERLVLRELMMSMRKRELIEPVNPGKRFPHYRLSGDVA